jgi:chemotaxis response regulator CheB
MQQLGLIDDGAVLACPQKIRVMLVDDSAVVRGLFDRALSRGRVRLRWWQRQPPTARWPLTVLQATMPVDVMVLDVEMPVMDGIHRTCRQLLALSHLSHAGDHGLHPH